MKRRIGLAIVSMMILVAFVGALVSPRTANRQDLSRAFEAPSRHFLLGTDELGRDTFYRMLDGAHLSLGIAGLAVVIGVGLGGLMGLAGATFRLAAAPVYWMLDVFQAMPNFLIIVLVLSLIDPGPVSIALALASVGWVQPCRVVLVTSEFSARSPAVEAARLVEMPPIWIALRFLAPPLAGPLTAVAGTMFGQSILLIAGIGFLGLGLRPPVAEWSAMIVGGTPYLEEAPRLVVVPVAAITLTVTGIFLLFDRPER